jgi:hypothetical protein
MKTFRRIAGWIAGSLAAGHVALAAGPNPVCAPYATITNRNVFGLIPIQPNPVVLAAAPQLPRVTICGVMNILGPEQVLIEVADSAPERPARKSCYALSHGQVQDGIKILGIDTKSGVVTIENHGTTQTISIRSATPESRTAPNHVSRPFPD